VAHPKLERPLCGSLSRKRRVAGLVRGGGAVRRLL